MPNPQEPAMSPTPHFRVVPQDNPPFRVNELFVGCENLRSPRFVELRRRFAIDEAVRGVEGEFARILALRHWIARRIRIENDHPTPVAHMDAWAILEAAEAGGGFHCAHFRLVQQAVLNAYGYVTRSLGVGDGRLDRGRHHGVNEVWVNELGKWVLTDAKYDLHYEKAGVPLSALELRVEILENGGAAVERAYGPRRERREDPHSDTLETYRWLSWELNGNAFSEFPNHVSSAVVLLEDEFVQTNTWYRDGKPHWAYAAGFFVTTTHRSWVEWTPNVVGSHVEIAGSTARMALSSCTPNFATYAMRREAKSPWESCADRLNMAVPSEGLRLEFRAENLAGVAGPVHRIDIEPVG
jgi:hypothetical protein